MSLRVLERLAGGRAAFFAAGRLAYGCLTFAYLAGLFRNLSESQVGELLTAQVAASLVVTVIRAGIERIAFWELASIENRRDTWGGQWTRNAGWRAVAGLLLGVLVGGGLHFAAGVEISIVAAMTTAIPAWLVGVTAFAARTAKRTAMSVVALRDIVQPAIPAAIAWTALGSSSTRVAWFIAASWWVIAATVMLSRRNFKNGGAAQYSAVLASFRRNAIAIHWMDVCRLYAPGLIGAFVLGAGSMAPYWAALRYAMFTAMPLAVVVAGASPELAASRGRRPYWRLVRSTASAAGSATLVAHGFFVVFGLKLLSATGLQSEALAEGWQVLLLLSFAHSIDGIAGTSAEALIYDGQIGTERRLQVVGIALGVPMAVVAVIASGPIGLAIVYALWLGTINVGRIASSILAARSASARRPLGIGSMIGTIVAATATYVAMRDQYVVVALGILTCGLAAFLWVERASIRYFLSESAA